MKLRYRVNEKIEFEIEAVTQKDIFTELAQTDEVFGEPSCGACGSDDIFFRVRNSTAKQGKNKGKTFTYFEIACRKCFCYLPVGQHNSDAGTLFPDRKIPDANGTPVYDKTNRGWRKPATRKDEESEE